MQPATDRQQQYSLTAEHKILKLKMQHSTERIKNHHKNFKTIAIFFYATTKHASVQMQETNVSVDSTQN